jgi:hypothetical protein
VKKKKRRWKKNLKPPSDRTTMRERISLRVFPIILGCLVIAGLTACAPSTDPVDMLDAHYEAIIRIIRDSDTDIKAKMTAIETYWKTHQGELAIIQKSLEDEMSRLADEREKVRFAERFEKFLYRLRELQALLREQGIDL